MDIKTKFFKLSNSNFDHNKLSFNFFQIFKNVVINTNLNNRLIILIPNKNKISIAKTNFEMYYF